MAGDLKIHMVVQGGLKCNYERKESSLLTLGWSYVTCKRCKKNRWKR